MKSDLRFLSLGRTETVEIEFLLTTAGIFLLTPELRVKAGLCCLRSTFRYVFKIQSFPKHDEGAVV